MAQCDYISYFISAIGVIISALAAFFTYKNLKEIRCQNFELNRGNIILYIEKSRYNDFHHIIIKNFGNSPAMLKKIMIDPPITWRKTPQNIPSMHDVENLRNIFLAPNQSIQTIFDFRNYEDTRFHIALVYNTLNKDFAQTYDIDLEFSKKVLYRTTSSKDEIKALDNLTHSIEELSEKFR